MLRAEDAARAGEQALLQLQSQRAGKQAELAVLTADSSLTAPSFDLYTAGELPDIEADVAALAAEARALRPLRVLLDQQAARRRGLEEQRRPELTLTVSGGLTGAAERAIDSLDVLDPDLTVALLYGVPSAHTTIDAGISAIEARDAQISEEQRSILVELEAGLRGLFAQIREMERILELGRQQIDSALQKTEEEIRLYNQGRGQLTFVILSRDDEQNARLALADDAALYHGLLLRYRALADRLMPGGGR